MAVLTKNAPSAGTLVALCFDARTRAHKAHLKTTSYAAHVALGAFYDAIVGLADSFAESYQGRYGELLDIPDVRLTSSEGLNLVVELRTWIDANRAKICDHSEIQNIIDEIVDLCNSTIYKLKFLK